MPACNTCWLLFSKMKNPGKACAVLSLGSGLPDPALRASSHHLFSFLDCLRDVHDPVVPEVNLMAQTGLVPREFDDPPAPFHGNPDTADVLIGQRDPGRFRET